MQDKNSDLCIELGKRLRNARIANHMTQEQLSEKAHVTSKYISDIEKGRVNPSYEILYALVSALHISADILFFPAHDADDLLFQRLAAYYRACPLEKREVLIQTMEFVQEKLLSEDK